MKMLNKAILMAGLVGITSVVMANDDVINKSAQIQNVTVQQALTLKDDTQVQIKGFVVKAVGDEKYQFRDSTGTIIVDIDDELWQGKAVSAKTPITIVGEVDVDFKPTKRVEIDVDQVTF